MGLNVFWTDSAIENLENIFDYYKSNVSNSVAQNIVKSIVDKTILLEEFCKMGQIEELLLDRNNEYRYLVVGNFKIIYWLDSNTIIVASVFDCRQDPVKVQKIQ